MKARKSALKIVAKPEQEWPEWQKDFYANIKNERDRLTPSQHERDVILSDLIDAIDQHFIESAFNCETVFDVEGFIDKLKPHARVVEKRLRKLLPDDYEYLKYSLHEPDAELTQMIMDIEKSAYEIGVFMGAKLCGTSAERLNALRKHLTS